MTSKRFWKDLAERAAKSVAQSLILLIGTDAISVTDLDWQKIIGISITYGIISVLTSIASYGPAGDNASLVLGDNTDH